MGKFFDLIPKMPNDWTPGNGTTQRYGLENNLFSHAVISDIVISSVFLAYITDYEIFVFFSWRHVCDNRSENAV